MTVVINFQRFGVAILFTQDNAPHNILGVTTDLFVIVNHKLYTDFKWTYDLHKLTDHIGSLWVSRSTLWFAVRSGTL